MTARFRGSGGLVHDPENTLARTESGSRTARSLARRPAAEHTGPSVNFDEALLLPRTRDALLDWNVPLQTGRLCPVSIPHVALITGSGRGIGAAIAAKLAREGAAVIVAARSQEACLDVAHEIRDTGGLAWPLHLDVGDPESIETAVGEARELTRAIGPIDWLVNNAGIAISAPFLEHGRKSGVDLYEQHLSINFHGPRRLCEALIPAMIERKYGRVVHIASSAGLKGYAYAAAYSASKHALVGYGRSASAELAQTGVTMNMVCPHYVDSPMTEQSIARVVAKTKKSAAEARAFFAAQNPGGGLVSVEEVAGIVFELLNGDKNGTIAELVGGGVSAPRAARVNWR
jgi:NAD(P)-dependent dehydrogenase (short-subunit alcohol dehydrogenase family)